ncbi:cysteine synthase A [Erythrobacter sp. 3-20A1M]|nr:cysteine synthase A [Erythrobacter sp. 3-20A1M]
MTTADTLSLIGNTPLVRLAGPSEAAGCDIFGKCEFTNPGASVKDRAALFIVRDAEEKGLLKPGGTVVEGTAGNTGIGLALVANARGYRTIIVMPENQSREKMDTLRALGAELVLVPPTKYANPGHFVHTSRRLAEETEGAVWANQFDNTANRKAHIEGTAKELWEQLDGRIDGFTCAAGTGGTIAGTGMGLKSYDEDCVIALTDPHGAALYNYYAHGELEAEGSSVAEGIGQGRITGNLEGAPIDTQFRISDEEGLAWVARLLREEGLCLGLSSGINVAGAVALGKMLVEQGREAPRVATILCDTGFRYLSTLYDADWLRSKACRCPTGCRGRNDGVEITPWRWSENAGRVRGALPRPRWAARAGRRCSACRSGCSAWAR